MTASPVRLWRSERDALCDLLIEKGPDAPTLCGDWTTRDLAAHLHIRENRPDAAVGIVIGPLARWTAKVQADVASGDYGLYDNLFVVGLAVGTDFGVGSVADLSARSGRELTGMDLHRPFVDDVSISCPECSGTAYRVEPVLDAWFDSGSMPAAQWHHPFENADVFERRFPADFICEAIDQTRGWFYAQLAISTLMFGKVEGGRGSAEGKNLPPSTLRLPH